MTRDEFLEDIRQEVLRICPENKPLDSDSIEDLVTVVQETCDNAEEALDESADEEADAESDQ